MWGDVVGQRTSRKKISRIPRNRVTGGYIISVGVCKCGIHKYTPIYMNGYFGKGSSFLFGLPRIPPFPDYDLSCGL